MEEFSVSTGAERKEADLNKLKSVFSDYLHAGYTWN